MSGCEREIERERGTNRHVSQHVMEREKKKNHTEMSPGTRTDDGEQPPMPRRCDRVEPE